MLLLSGSYTPSSHTHRVGHTKGGGGMGRTEAGRKADCVVGRGGEHDGLGRVEEYIRVGGGGGLM